MFKPEKKKPRGEGKRRRVFKRKVCKFCMDKVKSFEYFEYQRFQKFITERGKIVPSRISGNCARHQRQLARAIKRARIAALVPFVAE